MKYSFLFFLVLVPFSLAGCQSKTAPTSEPTVSEVNSLTELTGIFTTNDPAGSKGTLKTSTGSVAVESLVLDLTQLNGTTVTLVGKYSGDTLFVSAVK